MSNKLFSKIATISMLAALNCPYDYSIKPAHRKERKYVPKTEGYEHGHRTPEENAKRKEHKKKIKAKRNRNRRRNRR